jgi:hypothetical protein
VAAGGGVACEGRGMWSKMALRGLWPEELRSPWQVLPLKTRTRARAPSRTREECGGAGGQRYLRRQRGQRLADRTHAFSTTLDCRHYPFEICSVNLWHSGVHDRLAPTNVCVEDFDLASKSAHSLPCFIHVFLAQAEHFW